MAEQGVEIQSLATSAERSAAVDLVQHALELDWRFGSRTLAKTLTDALLAYRQGELVGVVALHHGSPSTINVVAVRDGARRRGIGSALVAAACAELRRRGAGTVEAAGGGPYLWPGIPRNVAGALEFFTANGWQLEEDVYDLTRPLADFVTPPEVAERALRAGVTCGPATAADRDWLALHGDEQWYPGWGAYFAASAPANILVGRDRHEQVAAALILGYPGESEHWQPLLGPAVTTIGCVGTIQECRDQGIGTALVAAGAALLRQAGGAVCHIGWTTLLTFYGRLGFTPWRAYARATRPT